MEMLLKWLFEKCKGKYILILVQMIAMILTINNIMIKLMRDLIFYKILLPW